MKHMQLKLIPVFLLSLLSFGCTVKEAISPPRESGFIKYRDSKLYEGTTPFAYFWAMRKPDQPKREFSKLSVQIIPTDYLDKESWTQSKTFIMMTEDDYLRSVHGIAEYFYQHISADIHNALKKESEAFMLVNEYTDEDLRIEIAFTEMVFGHPLISGTSSLIPVPASSHLLDVFTMPYVSLEGRVIDTRTNEIIATFADKKFPKFKIIDFNKFTASSPVREVVEIWAAEITETIFSKPGEKVSAESGFSLIPW